MLDLVQIFRYESLMSKTSWKFALTEEETEIICKYECPAQHDDDSDNINSQIKITSRCIIVLNNIRRIIIRPCVLFTHIKRSYAQWQTDGVNVSATKCTITVLCMIIHTAF